MKKTITRRGFIKNSAAVSASVMASSMWPLNSFAFGSKPKPRVVIVGGGFGGATCAKYIKKFDSNIDVTLVERDAKFVNCPFSNLVLGGIKNIDDITHGYDALKSKYGINVLQDEVTDLDADKQMVKTKGGKSLEYDRVVFSPGITM